MKQFSKNILRLALKSRASFIGAVLIIGIGIFCYVGVSDTMKNLETQVDTYYDDYGLADIFATVEAIPASDLQRLCEIPGIEAVSGKLSADLRMLGPDQTELVTVHLMSYDPDDTINRLRIQSLRPTAITDEAVDGDHMKQNETAGGADVTAETGTDAGSTSLSQAATDALYLGSRMAEVYRYPEGTELRLVHDGEVKHLSYAGRCSAPDYIYSIPPGGAMIPDGEVYDIACIDLDDMKDLMGMLPGMDKALKDVDIPEDAFKSTEAIIQSMTPYEKEHPECLNGSRRSRIAKGSGTTLADVNKLIKQFEQSRKMMKMAVDGTLQQKLRSLRR